MKDTAHVKNLQTILNRIANLEAFIEFMSDEKELHFVLKAKNTKYERSILIYDNTELMVNIISAIEKEISRLCNRVENIVNDNEYPDEGGVPQLTVDEL